MEEIRKQYRQIADIYKKLKISCNKMRDLCEEKDDSELKYRSSRLAIGVITDLRELIIDLNSEIEFAETREKDKD